MQRFMAVCAIAGVVLSLAAGRLVAVQAPPAQALELEEGRY